MELETDRIILRQWQEQDLPLFAALNADPEVMEFFPKQLNRQESEELARRCQSQIDEKGWSFWAAELKETQEFIGFLGLHNPKASLPISPCIEIGWRLAKQYWGYGYATEAAQRALKFAFETLNETEVTSYTAASNIRSRAVMERLGFSNTEQNFMHPDIPLDHPLCGHVVYKISQCDWRNSNA